MCRKCLDDNEDGGAVGCLVLFILFVVIPALGAWSMHATGGNFFAP